MLAYKDGWRVRLISRHAVDHAVRFRELAAAIAKLKPDIVVLDDEVAVGPRVVAAFTFGDWDRRDSKRLTDDASGWVRAHRERDRVAGLALTVNFKVVLREITTSAVPVGRTGSADTWYLLELTGVGPTDVNWSVRIPTLCITPPGFA